MLIFANPARPEIKFCSDSNISALNGFATVRFDFIAETFGKIMTQIKNFCMVPNAFEDYCKKK